MKTWHTKRIIYRKYPEENTVLYIYGNIPNPKIGKTKVQKTRTTGTNTGVVRGHQEMQKVNQWLKRQVGA